MAKLTEIDIKLTCEQFNALAREFIAENKSKLCNLPAIGFTDQAYRFISNNVRNAKGNPGAILNCAIEYNVDHHR